MSEQEKLPETALHLVWLRQWRLPSLLHTVDGRPVEVFHPGWLRYAAGPDFQRAVLRVGEAWVQGNVEIHLQSRDWYHHGHARDPRYTGVVLHVVYIHNSPVRHASAPRTSIPEIALDTYLAAKDFKDIPDLPVKDRPRGPRCLAYLHGWKPERVREFLERMGIRYLLERAALIRQEMHKDDAPSPTEALYRKIMRSLGYAYHRALFERLAVRLPWSEFLPAARRDPQGLYHRILHYLDWLPSCPGSADVPCPEPWVPELPRRPGGIRPWNDPARRLAWMVMFAHRSEPGQDPLDRLLDAARRLILEPTDRKGFRSFWRHLVREIKNIDWRPPAAPLAELLDLRLRGPAMGDSRWTTLWWNAIIPVVLAEIDPQHDLGRRLQYQATGPMDEDWIQNVMKRQFGAYAAAVPRRNPLGQLGWHGLFKSACNDLTVTCARCPLNRDMAISPPLEEKPS